MQHRLVWICNGSVCQTWTYLLIYQFLMFFFFFTYAICLEDQLSRGTISYTHTCLIFLWNLCVCVCVCIYIYIYIHTVFTVTPNSLIHPKTIIKLYFLKNIYIYIYIYISVCVCERESVLCFSMSCGPWTTKQILLLYIIHYYY